MADATSELQHAYRRSRKVAKSNDLMVDFGKQKIALLQRYFFFVHLLLTTRHSYYKWTGTDSKSNTASGIYYPIFNDSRAGVYQT
jgi:hypothetical protein